MLLRHNYCIVVAGTLELTINIWNYKTFIAEPMEILPGFLLFLPYDVANVPNRFSFYIFSHPAAVGQGATKYPPMT